MYNKIVTLIENKGIREDLENYDEKNYKNFIRIGANRDS